jgi:hypothetical protein
MVAWRTMADGVFFGGLQGERARGVARLDGKRGIVCGAEARNTQCAHWTRFSGRRYTRASVEGRGLSGAVGKRGVGRAKENITGLPASNPLSP